MDITIKTLGALKKSGYQSRSIKTELRENLIQNIKDGRMLCMANYPSFNLNNFEKENPSSFMNP